jgi:chromosome segregation ATPase
MGIGVFVIAFVAMFFLYARQSSEQEELESSLAGAQTQLAKLISGRQSLETQLSQQQSKLAETQALLDSALASFPELEANIEYNEVLTELAEDYDLEVVSMAADTPRENDVEGVVFLVISFEVKVKGELSSILNMINAIATDERFSSATIETVNIDIPEPELILATLGQEPEQSSGTIKLVGYSYGGE